MNRQFTTLGRSFQEEKAIQEQKATQRYTVNKLLQDAPFRQGYAYLFGWHEWQELDMAEYVRLFNRTQTAFGSWGLEQLTKPIVDFHVIELRQQSIKQCDEQVQRTYRFYQLLDDIRQYEEALLCYYDMHDQLNAKAEQLYYTCFKSLLNNNKIALDYAYIADMFSSASNLATLLCLNGLLVEFIQAQAEGRSLHIVDGVMKGFGDVFTSHSPYDTTYQTLKNKQAFISPSTIQSGQQVTSFSPLSIIKSMGAYAKRAYEGFMYTVSNPASIHIITRGSLGDRWSFYNEQCHSPSLLSLVWALGQVAYQDHVLYLRIRQNYKRLAFLFHTHVALQHRCVKLAKLFESIQELMRMSQDVPALKDHVAVRKAYDLFEHERMKELYNQLQSSTYSEDKQFFYSRGQVLMTHKLVQEIKEDIIPVLQAVGLIDGFISIYSVYQEHKQSNEQPFCFAKILKSDTPFYQVHDGWLPLIPGNHVHNSCTLGGDQAHNMLLTGPNGGGKSSFLKLVGGSVALAQSWGIVPARSCTMSLCNGLRTSFNPQEDIKHDISTFMAQKEQLAKLEQFIEKASPEGTYMLLIDEPYRGTIEAEAEKRAYLLGKKLGSYPYGMTIIASHLTLPLTLEEDGLFINKQFKLEEYPDGSFKRTFQLHDGAAWWWFQDIDKRMRFIDWLHAYAS